jgi:hypothetical protein
MVNLVKPWAWPKLIVLNFNKPEAMTRTPTNMHDQGDILTKRPYALQTRSQDWIELIWLAEDWQRRWVQSVLQPWRSGSTQPPILIPVTRWLIGVRTAYFEDWGPQGWWCGKPMEVWRKVEDKMHLVLSGSLSISAYSMNVHSSLLQVN